MDRQPIQLYIITGFLGSGKTSLLKNLLHFHDQEKTGVIMNEFGKISIDGQILGNTAGDIIEINNGSIFCSCLQGSFLEGLISFAQYPIRALFVECSGLSDPSNLGDLLQIANHKTNNRYQYRGSICLVDGVHFSKLASALPVLEKQVRHSHLIVLNKTDLITEADQQDVFDQLKAINPSATIYPTTYSQLPANLLNLEIMVEAGCSEGEISCNTPESRLKTITLETDGLFQKEPLLCFLESIQENVYRAKGFFHLEEGWHQADLVGGLKDVTPAIPSRNSSILVMIAAGEDPFLIEQITRHWKHHFSEPMSLSES